MIRTARTHTFRLAITIALASGIGAVGAHTAAAQAQVQNGQQTVAIENQVVAVPGSGSFNVNGGLHLQFHTTRDAAGGYHIEVHANAQGISATSTSGGANYRVNGAANAELNIGATKGAASEGTAVLNLGLIGQGQAPNLRLHVNLHLTVNANGDVTATVANVRITQS